MEKLVHRLQRDYPTLIFTVGAAHCWSPRAKQIFYEEDDQAGLLHELGHATLEHRTYVNDLDLLQKEVEAWDKARELAAAYGVVISEEHIQDCLDTYRDWLHKRSQCPTCTLTSIQRSRTEYACLNCGQTWRVSAARFHRPYRRRAATKNRR
jgi:hypothetical protein